MSLVLSPNSYVFSYPDGGVIYCRDINKEYTIGLNELNVINNIRFNGEIASEMPFQQVDSIIKQFKELGILVEEDCRSCPKKKALSIELIKKEKKIDEKSKKVIKTVNWLIIILTLLTLALLIAMALDGKFSNISLNAVNTINPELNFSNAIAGFFFFSLFPTLGHELSHAITARYYKCHVTEIGLIFRGIFLCFYVRIIGMGRCKKIEKIHILLSGMIFNAFLFSLSLLTARLAFSENTMLYNVLVLNAFSNLSMVILNSLCLFKLDGHLVIKNFLIDNSLYATVKETFKKMESEIIFLSLIQTSSLLLCLSFGLVYLPIITHIFVIVLIFIIFLREDEDRVPQAYCQFIFLFGLMSLIPIILQAIKESPEIAVVISTVILFLLALSFCAVWIGSLLYFISHTIKKRKK